MIWISELFRSSVQRLYDYLLRPHLPYKISVHNGVAVRGVARLFDFSDVFPEYEGPLINALRKNVSPGDHVVVVGGGLGVSTVVAARCAGKNGSVLTFEGGKERCEIIRETVALNEVEDNCEIRRSIVGEEVRVMGESASAGFTPASELPECDVLELDCEGSEVEILDKLAIRPKTIVVETHGFLDAPVDEVRTKLRRFGYRVESQTGEGGGRGVFILTAVLDR